MKRNKLLVAITLTVALIAHSEESMDALVFETHNSYGSTYALTFKSKTDRVTVAFNSNGQEVSVKGLRFKYLINISQVNSITFEPVGSKGILKINTAGKVNEIGLIEEVDFDIFATEIKQRISNLKTIKLY